MCSAVHIETAQLGVSIDALQLEVYWSNCSNMKSNLHKQVTSFSISISIMNARALEQLMSAKLCPIKQSRS
jgi:hypothetical protein